MKTRSLWGLILLLVLLWPVGAPLLRPSEAQNLPTVPAEVRRYALVTRD